MQNPTTQIDDETYFPTHFSEAIFSGVVLRVGRTELQDDSATKMAIFYSPHFLNVWRSDAASKSMFDFH